MHEKEKCACYLAALEGPEVQALNQKLFQALKEFQEFRDDTGDLFRQVNTLKAENNLLKDQIACATDLANTWAREFGVMECTEPYFGLFLRDLISRLWDKAGTKYLSEFARADAYEKALEAISVTWVCGCNARLRAEEALAAHRKAK